MFTLILGHILAVGIGISLGLLGGGGSVLALPILVYVMGISPKSAIAMTLVIVGSVSLIGVIPHWRKGYVNLKTTFIFGSATMVGAFLGARIAALPIVTAAIQMLLFGVAMLVAAVFMIYRSSQKTEEQELANYPTPLCKYCWLWLMTEGFAVGVLTGLVGVGGGFAIVPALVLLGKIPMRQAIGTSLLIIALNAIAGFVGYLGQVNVDWSITISFTLASGIGSVLGSYMAQFISVKQLQTGFGYFLLAVAAFVLVQNRHSFQPATNQSNTSQHYTGSSQKVRSIRT